MGSARESNGILWLRYEDEDGDNINVGDEI